MIQFFKSMFTTEKNPAITKAIENNAVLLDVRTAAEFAEGSIPGAINIPLQSLAGSIRRLKNKKAIVVFCRSGNRSQMAAQLLKQQQVNDVIDGGGIHNMQQYF